MAKDEVFVNQDNMALFHCPYCGKMKHVSVEKFKGKKHSLKVKCSCTRTFAVNLNFRKRYRKETDLDGRYLKMAGGRPAKINTEGDVNCKIVNISMGGLGLRILDGQAMAGGDNLIVNFTLDDKKQSELTRRVVIRHVKDSYVGCEFNDSDDHAYEKTLGFYLMP